MSLYLDLKSLITKSGFTMKSVNDELNSRYGTNYSAQNFSKKLKNESLKYKDVVDILDVIGYTISWIPK